MEPKRRLKRKSSKAKDETAETGADSPNPNQQAQSGGVFLLDFS